MQRASDRRSGDRFYFSRGEYCRLHFGGSALTLDKLTVFGWHPFAGSPVQIYVGFVALVVNLLVAVLVTAALRAGKVDEGADATHPDDFHAERYQRSVTW